MKRITSLFLPLILIVGILISCVPVGAASYKSLRKNPNYSYGVDVSQWNGDLDWNRLREVGVEFAYIRLGYYYPGGGTLDIRFEQNVKGAVESGIDFGVYIYSHVYTYTDNIAMAKWAHKKLKTLGNYTKDRDTIQVVVDVEDEAQTDPYYSGWATRRYIHNGVQKFCNQIKSYGYIPGIYASESFFRDLLYMEEYRAKGVKIWYAQWPYYPDCYTKKKTFNGTAPDTWQFCDNSTIDGTVFDTNVIYDDFYDYSKEDSTLRAEGLKTSYSLNNSGVKPKVKIYSGNTLLKEGADYKTFYYKNKRTGRARMKVVRFNDGKYIESKTFTYIIKPVAVQNLKAAPSYDEITLTWDKQNGAKGYQIFEYDSSDKSYNLIDTVKTNSYTDYFLDEGASYRLKVRSIAVIDGKTVYGNCSEVSVKTTYKPLKLNSAVASKGTLKVEWTPKTADTKGYIVEYSVNKDFSGKQKLKVTGINSSSAAITGLDKYTRYYVRARSYNVKNGVTYYSGYSKIFKV